MHVGKLIYASLLFICFYSCKNKEPAYGKPVSDPSGITGSFISFWQYKEDKVKLYEEFVALDEERRPVPQDTFLRRLTTGMYLPLRLQATDSTACYQLHPLKEGTDPEIQETIKAWANEEYAWYRLEGTEVPRFSFTDMQGKKYNSESIKGKTVVLKCWFVNCLPCRQEMPALNEIKQQYKDRDDILFLSICLDDRKEVAAFLKETKFDYAVIPGQQSYITDSLQVEAYPTHFVINKEGRIVKRLTDYRGMAYILKKEAELH